MNIFGTAIILLTTTIIALKFCSFNSYFGTFDIKFKLLSVKDVKGINTFLLSLDLKFFCF